MLRCDPKAAGRQLAQLQHLLRAVVPANPFYTRKLAGLLDPAVVPSLEAFSERTPFTTKAELVADQAQHPPYGTNLTFPEDRYTRCHATSGSTGQPLRWLDTPESWQWMLDNWKEIYRAAGVRRTDRFYFAFSFGPFLGFWTAFEAAQQLLCFCITGGGLSSGARLRAVLDNDTDVLCCTPTYAIRLAESAAAERVDLRQSPVRLVIVAGEPGGSIPATRARIEQLWPGARVFDHHGMTEVGPVTYQCPAAPGVLHVLESSYYAEVIEPVTGRPTPAGGRGELVLTPLGRVGSPLLRYRTGDVVQIRADLAVPCVCGRRDLALAGGILGRVDDMVIIRGVNVYPSAVEEVIRRCGGVAEYQVQVTAVDALAELRVRVEPEPATGEPEAFRQRLERALQTAFSLRVPVGLAAPGSLPRFEMKARRWVKEN